MTKMSKILIGGVAALTLTLSLNSSVFAAEIENKTISPIMQLTATQSSEGYGNAYEYVKTLSNGVQITSNYYSEGSLQKGTRVYFPHAVISKYSGGYLASSIVENCKYIPQVYLVSMFVTGNYKDIIDADVRGGYNGATLFIPYKGYYWKTVSSGHVYSGEYK